MIPAVLISGFSDSGKTTIVEKLLRILTEKGYEVATVKHHHGGKLDLGEDRDSTKHLNAGASSVSLSSKSNYVVIKRVKKEKTLSDILSEIENVDLILVEGYKRENFPKIEVYRSELDNPRLKDPDGNIIGVVSDIELPDRDIPVFGFNQTDKLAEFIQTKFLR